jgi:hypothetical protein
VSGSKQIRKALLAIYGKSYKRWFHDEPGCFYCGDIAQVIDHCPPVIWADQTANGDKKIRIYHWLIRACYDCNARLGSRALLSAHDRIVFIARKLESEYERRNSMWSDKEIAEMGFSFRADLISRKRILLRLLDRVRFAQWRECATDTHPPEYKSK